MLGFKLFIEDSARPISASGADAVRHLHKYIIPYVQPQSDTLNYTHSTRSGKRVAILGYGQNIKGATTVKVKHADDSDHEEIPASQVLKPNVKVTNAGHAYEDGFHRRMQKYGLASETDRPAGSTMGSDSVIRDKTTGKKYNVEVKADITAAMGQIAIKYDPNRGWFIPDRSRERRGAYAKSIEEAGLLDHLNAHYDPTTAPTTVSGRAKSIALKHPNLNPAKAYLTDHHVDILQVGTHGTYSVHNRALGLPELTGKGKWTIREKQFGAKNTRMVQFQADGVSGLTKSPINLDRDEDLEKFKKSLGY